MAEPHEIPQLTAELIDMSREYLRQETLEPAKQLGRHAGKGIGFYSALRMWLPGGAWWVVLARFVTAVAAAGGAAVVGWRMQERADQ
jgi:hypothetical protein